jgi:hypothetical protein
MLVLQLLERLQNTGLAAGRIHDQLVVARFIVIVNLHTVPRIDKLQ